MWEKLSVFCVILALALSPLAAWPTWLTGEVNSPEIVEKIIEVPVEVPVEVIKEVVREVPVPSDSQEIQDLISSMKESAKLLEAELNLLKTDLTDSQKTIETLNKELEQQKKLLGTSKTSFDSLKSDYDKLAVSKEGPAWGGSVGGGVIWNPTANTFGANVNLGVSYKAWGFHVGANYEPATWALALPKVTDFSFMAGGSSSF